MQEWEHCGKSAPPAAQEELHQPRRSSCREICFATRKNKQLPTTGCPRAAKVKASMLWPVPGSKEPLGGCIPCLLGATTWQGKEETFLAPSVSPRKSSCSRELTSPFPAGKNSQLWLPWDIPWPKGDCWVLCMYVCVLFVCLIAVCCKRPGR